MKSAHNPFALAGLLLLPLMLPACQAEPRGAAAEAAPAETAAPEKPATCTRAAAEALAGKNRLSDEQASRLTGADIVRQVAPGTAVSKEYREGRVTLETDPASGKIVRAYCG